MGPAEDDPGELFLSLSSYWMTHLVDVDGLESQLSHSLSPVDIGFACACYPGTLVSCSVLVV